MSELGLGPWWNFRYVLLVVGHFAGCSVNLTCCCRRPWQRGSRSSKAYLKGSQILHSPIGWVSQKMCCCLADCHLGERKSAKKRTEVCGKENRVDIRHLVWELALYLTNFICLLLGVWAKLTWIWMKKFGRGDEMKCKRNTGWISRPNV